MGRWVPFYQLDPASDTPFSGYNELNFMNGTRGILTPNLDALANAGVVMKNYYVQPIW